MRPPERWTVVEGGFEPPSKAPFHEDYVLAGAPQPFAVRGEAVLWRVPWRLTDEARLRHLEAVRRQRAEAEAELERRRAAEREAERKRQEAERQRRHEAGLPVARELFRAALDDPKVADAMAEHWTRLDEHVYMAVPRPGYTYADMRKVYWHLRDVHDCRPVPPGWSDYARLIREWIAQRAGLNG